ncbi:hypothetical protein HAZT_HAZT005851, partial [Hyalella azteca]
MINEGLVLSLADVLLCACSRVHITGATLAQLDGRFQVESGDGHLRDQLLADLKVQTYLIVNPKELDEEVEPNSLKGTGNDLKRDIAVKFSTHDTDQYKSELPMDILKNGKLNCGTRAAENITEVANKKNVHDSQYPPSTTNFANSRSSTLPPDSSGHLNFMADPSSTITEPTSTVSIPDPISCFSQSTTPRASTPNFSVTILQASEGEISVTEQTETTLAKNPASSERIISGQDCQMSSSVRLNRTGANASKMTKSVECWGSGKPFSSLSHSTMAKNITLT